MRCARHIGLALLYFFVCVVSASAGWIEVKEDRTVIHVAVWWLPHPSDTSTFNRADLAAQHAFLKRFPALFAERYRAKYEADPARYGKHDWSRVEIQLHPFSGIKVEGVESDLLAIAGGMAPDVLYVNFRKSDNYIRNGFLYPLDRPEDGYLSAMTPEELEFRVHPKIWPVIKRRGPDGGKHVWALPWGGAMGRVLMFRKDLFDAKDVAYPDADWTWDDLLSAARRLTDPAVGVYGMLLSRTKHQAWHLLPYLWSAGGEIMTYDEEADRWSCVFDSRPAATALDFYIQLSAERWVDAGGIVRRGYSSKDTGDLLGKWARGEIAMRTTYLDEKVFSTVNPEVTGLAPVPLGPDGGRGTELNSKMWGLFADIDDPVVRDAAWEYIRYYESEDAVAIRTQVMVEGGLGRFVNPRYLRMFGYPEIERLAPRGWAETFETTLAAGRPEPYGRNSNLLYDIMTRALEQAEELARNDVLPENPEARVDTMQEILRDACSRANAEMIGIVPPAERTKRRVTAVFALLAIAVTFTLLVRKAAAAFAPEDPMGRRQGWGFRKHAWAYVLLLPAVLSILLWQYYPLARGSVMAFQDYRLLGASTWVGVDNFGDLLYDGYWWRAAWNSVRYSILVLVLTFLPPLALAILLQEVPRGRLLLRTLFYLPAVITGLVTVVLWKQFYDPSDQGVLNAVVMRIPAWGFVGLGVALFALALLFALRLWRQEMRLAAWGAVVVGVMLLTASVAPAAGILFPASEGLLASLVRLPMRLFSRPAEAFNWLSDPDTAMAACVIPMVWAGIGPGSLIYLAALKGIADDYYEAADIDGAGFVDKILFIVFPILKPLLVINFIGVFINSWYGATASILVMTGGSANTEVAGLHIWYKAFTYLKFGPATAMAWVLGFMLIGFTVYQLRILARVEFMTTGGEKEGGRDA